MDYTYTQGPYGLIRSDGAFIPADVGNSDYQAYLAFIAAGGSLVVPSAADQLATAQTDQIALLSTACASAITSGFTSSALGQAYIYPSKATDQQNLSASVLNALLVDNCDSWAASTAYEIGDTIFDTDQAYVCTTAGTTSTVKPTWPTVVGDTVVDSGVVWQVWTTLFWCEDSAQNWAFLNHTSSQIQKVGIDAKNAILLNMTQNATLATEVVAATTITAVQAIVWPTVA